MCPPQPLELMQQIAGDSDAFNGAWWDHIPAVEPPNIEQLADFAVNQPWVNKRLRDGGEAADSPEVGDSGFLDRHSLRSILWRPLMRPSGSVLCVAMKKVSSPLMRKKKVLIKGFAPDQIARSYFLRETIGN
jgi:hypothetical protein